MATRYDPRGIETEFEPGSRRRVLRNRLAIRRVRDIQLAESQALQLVQREAINTFADDHCFTISNVCQLHRTWLNPIYDWAGEYRTVNVGKGGFQFASARLIPELMAAFEREVLRRYTPCQPGPDAKVAQALAVVHGELVLIHPFREGNGRLARLLALLMGLQAGLPPLDFSPLDGRGKRRYIAGVHAAMGNDYGLLTEMFVRVIDRTRTTASSSNR